MYARHWSVFRLRSSGLVAAKPMWMCRPAQVEGMISVDGEEDRYERYDDISSVASALLDREKMGETSSIPWLSQLSAFEAVIFEGRCD